MIKIEFDTMVMTTSGWHQAWLTKNGNSRLVHVGLPNYSWKESFEKYAKSRGFSVTWR